MSEDKPKKKGKADSNNEDFEFPALHTEEVSEPKPVEETPAPVEPTPPAEEPTPKIRLTRAEQIERFKVLFIRHKTIGLVIVFVLISALMWGISLLRAHKEEKETTVATAVDEIPVNVIETRLARFQDTINAVGTLKGEAEIELRFEVEGKIEDFNVVEGAKVRKGQVIARVNDRDAGLKVARARIELEQNEKLYQLGGVSKTKVDEARLNMDVAQAELDKTILIASRDGILGDKSAEIGEFVTPQRKIATLVAIKHVVVKVGVIEKQVDKVYPGQKILVTVDAYPGNIFEGVIESISPLIQGESKTFEITAKIPNPDSLLLPGMFARSRIITYQVEEAIAVPNDALAKTAGGFQVFVVNKDNVAEARDVEVGYVSAEFTQITSGLTPSETVVVQKPPELKAGSKVKVIEVQK